MSKATPAKRRGKTAGRRQAATPPAKTAARKAAARPRPAAAGGAAAARQVREALFRAWRAAESKKAEDIVALDVRGLAGFTDYFLIAHGGSARQVEAITEAIEEAVKRGRGPRLAHREGGAEAEWRVLDYLDFVVHIFSAGGRRFYDLERLWQKAPHLKLPARGGTARAKAGT
jgi:ribosome-associated protein